MEVAEQIIIGMGIPVRVGIIKMLLHQTVPIPYSPVVILQLLVAELDIIGTQQNACVRIRKPTLTDWPTRNLKPSPASTEFYLILNFKR